MELIEQGKWIFAVGKHLRAYAQDASIAYVFPNRESARAGELLMRLRGFGQISQTRLEALSLDAGIAPQELDQVVDRLEATDLISARRYSDGTLDGVTEAIFTENEVFRGIAEVFHGLNPNAVNRVFPLLLDLLSRLPLTEAEIFNRLSSFGYGEVDIRQAIELQEAFGLLTRRHVGEVGTTLLYNEYLWGHKIHRVGDLLLNLPTNDKDSLLALIDEVQSEQGLPTDQLTAAPDHIIAMAVTTGIINTTTIETKLGIEKTFTFSPYFYGYRAGSYSRIEDDMDQIKLFVSSMIYGTNYSSDFRLHSPIAFVHALLRNGEAGNATPILRDYPLLEKQGIVVVEERSRGRGTFVLKKPDVVRQALEVLEHGTLLDGSSTYYDGRNLSTLSGFRSPEANRIRATLGASPGRTLQLDDRLLAATREAVQKGEW